MTRKNIFKNERTNNVASAARKELTELQRSPLHVFNILNKLSAETQALAELSRRLRAYIGATSKAWCFAAIPQDSKGRLCRFATASAAMIGRAEADGEGRWYVDGNELREDGHGFYVLKPIQNTAGAYVGAAASLLRRREALAADIVAAFAAEDAQSRKATEKAERKHERDAKKRRDATRRGLLADYNNGRISYEAFISAIKAA